MRQNDWKRKIEQETPQRLDQIHKQFYAENGVNGHGHGHGHGYNRVRRQGHGHGHCHHDGVVRSQRHSYNSNNGRYAPRNGQRGQYQQRRGYQGNNHRGYHHKGYGGPYQRRKNSSNRPSVEFVRDVTLPDRSQYSSDKVLTKTWAMKNSGDQPWGDDVELVYFKGDESLCLHKRYPVISAVPGEVVEMSAIVRTPAEPGRYCTYFRLQKNGKFFGPRVWVDIIVDSPNSPRAATNQEAYKNALTRSIQSN